MQQFNDKQTKVPADNELLTEQERTCRDLNGWFSRADLAKLLGEVTQSLRTYANALIAADNITRDKQISSGTDPIQSLRVADVHDYAQLTGQRLVSAGIEHLGSRLFSSPVRPSWVGCLCESSALIAYQNISDQTNPAAAMKIEAFLLINDEILIRVPLKVSLTREKLTFTWTREEIIMHGATSPSACQLATVIADILSIRQFSMSTHALLSMMTDCQ